ncbi:PilZ domain-containing protein [Novosphingobium sp. G106]|uniref:PilZ domain-containing protein n=1 Tax=Novosphingobium sp. G106 TaxID=2849500 RepID=UPI001C2CE39D|nr:PilZ domain-containing protein [Novosphingobium sp. G106]MBV1686506.1 PilZ domain-containing protein [Novosphingobium sp. G106]
MAWFALQAEFSDGPDGAGRRRADRRTATRRKLAFDSLAVPAGPAAKVVVLDLSEAGLMLHAQDDLAVGEVFEVALPGAEAIEARVVWKRTTLYGCRFLSPVSRGMISAIVLKARSGAPIATGC